MKAAEILAFPALKTIPAPELPLKGVAYDKYRELAQALLVASKLNIHTKAICEQIGYIHGDNHHRIDLGRPIPGKQQERYDKLLKELRLVDESETAAAEAGQDENRFARFGKITRRGAKKAAVCSP